VWADANASFVLRSQKGDEATIVMRPEDIGLTESGKGFDAQVLDVTFLGHCYETVVGVRGAKVRTRSRTRPIAHDDRVIMDIQANAAWAVPCQ
jgi:ABC-type Fe3+/spermidine/putrescine transport system ATPase subunit